MLQASEQVPDANELQPDTTVSVADVFGIDVDIQVPAYSQTSDRVPDLDPHYIFDKRTTLAILAGFSNDWRVLVTGFHGTGKSTHIEQVAARLNWPCVRICLLYTSPSPRDGLLSRMPSSA